MPHFPSVGANFLGNECVTFHKVKTLPTYSWGLFLLNESSGFNVQISGREAVCGARTEQLETPMRSLSPAPPRLGGPHGKRAGHLPNALQHKSPSELPLLPAYSCRSASIKIRSIIKCKIGECLL